MALLLLGVTLGGVCAGCGDRSRRLGEREALEYKTALLRSRQAEVSPGQTKRFFYHPARTPAEIDRAFNDLAREHAADAVRERAAFTGSSSGGSALTRQKEGSSGESSVEGGGEGDEETSEERAGAPVEDVGGR